MRIFKMAVPAMLLILSIMMVPGCGKKTEKPESTDKKNEQAENMDKKDAAELAETLIRGIFEAKSGSSEEGRKKEEKDGAEKGKTNKKPSRAAQKAADEAAELYRELSKKGNVPDMAYVITRAVSEAMTDKAYSEDMEAAEFRILIDTKAAEILKEGSYNTYSGDPERMKEGVLDLLYKDAFSEEQASALVWEAEE